MANNSVSLASLDFNTLKQQFKDYLSSQTVFKDFNFDDSNINVLLDVMSYNSYLNSFYLNMVASEMFIDSAQKLDSVVSHAKELNYLPQSARSSRATVTFTASTIGIPSPFSIPKGTLFSGINSNGSFTFTTDQTYNFTSPNTTFTCSGVNIYEGQYVTDTFIIDYSQEQQKFVLSNPSIDLSSLTVTVTESGVNSAFTSTSTLYGLSSTSDVYFAQAAQNGQYEVVFGDNLFGRYPNNLALVTCNYRVSKGALADGITSFVITQDLGAINGGTAALSTITVTSSSAGGALQETIESIRFSAPRYFATQQRAVASDDYSALILDNFGGVIKDVAVYGGENLPQKQYGRVVVALQPSSGTVAPDYVKGEVSNFLLNYVSLPTRVIVSDPEYLYCSVETNIQYDQTKTLLLPEDIKGRVINSITAYSNDNLQKFNSDFRYSKFITAIDNADVSITSNQTSVKIIKKLTPLLNYATSYVIDFNNPCEVEQTGAAGYQKGPRFYDEPVITSSPFTYVDSNDVQYPLSYIRDDNYGQLVVYTFINDIFTVLNDAIGTVNYTTGVVVLTNLKTSAYNNYISLYAVPQNKDIIVNKDKILIIDPADITVITTQTVM
jgi:hypothetical protein